ncbi:MAG: Smr/MutS family protein [Bacteroidia bacterium]|nr:Smr/MutS family protein [Bacteroidia bacterium]
MLPSENLGVPRPESVIDLHIENLVDDHDSMDSTSILTYQKDHCQMCLDNAIVYQLDRIVFVHGVGNGILKKEVGKILKENPHVESYQDASVVEFGLGATEVILK